MASLLLELAESEPARVQLRPLEVLARLNADPGLLDGDTLALVARQLSTLAEAAEVHRLALPEPSSIGIAGRPVRPVLLVSTPRSGNNILRRLIARLGVVDLAVHSLDDLRWSAVPDGAVVQVHAHPNTTTDRYLDLLQPAVVTIVRHPFDILLSIRRYAPREPQSRYWLEASAVAASTDLRGLGDRTTFLRWAVSPEARELLEISAAWAERPGVHVVRYEELVAAPQRVCDALADWLGHARLADASAAMADEGALLPAAHRTFGGPGARFELEAEERSVLARAHGDLVRHLGYQVDA